MGIALPILRRRRFTGPSVPALSLYAIGAYDPDVVADFAGIYSANEYYRTGGSASTFSDLFTYTGASNKTMVDSDGKLKWAPHNLLTYSEDLTTTRGWSALSAGDGVLPVATNTSDVNPDGAAGSTKLTLDRGTADTSNYSIYRKQINLAAETTGSIWVKASSPGDVGKIIDVYQNAGNLFLTLVNVTLTDSWQKVSSPRGGTNTAQYLTVALYSTSASTGEVSVLIWGAHVYRSDLGGMVNNPDRNDSYVPTTSSAVYLPRRNHYGWNGSTWVNKGLLLETESRTNLEPDSNTFTTSLGTTIAQDAVSPDESANAWTITGDGSSGAHRINLVNGTVTATGVVYAVSVYAKAGSTNYLQILNGGDGGYFCNFDLSAGTVGTSGAKTTGLIESVGGSYYRCTAVFDGSGATLTSLTYAYLAPSSSATYGQAWTTSGTLIVYGAQLEAGSTPSSYMPTTGSTFTRAAETLTIPAAKMAWPTPNVIGPELVTNGTFDTDSDWSKAGTWAISGGVASTSASGVENLTQGSVFTVGNLYQISFDITSYTSGAVRLLCGSTSATAFFSAAGSYTAVLKCSGNTLIYFQTAGSGGVLSIDNVSVREIDPLSVSLQMQGEQTYVDDNAAANNTFLAWPDTTSSNYIWLFGDSDRGTGGVTFRQRAAGVVGGVESGGSAYSPGVNVPFNIASRHGSTFINGAVDGTALTANTTPTALPDLSATDFNLGYDYMGTIALFREDNNDWADAGIVTATSKPVNIFTPIISGSPSVGSVLTTTDGTWADSPSFTYQWLRNGVAIAGATASTYTLVSADLGANISCRITATLNGLSTDATSNTLGPVVAVPAGAIRDRADDPILDRAGAYIEVRA